MDFFIIVANVTILLPIKICLLYLDSLKVGSYHSTWPIIGCTLIYIPITVASFCIYILREKNAFDPFPPHMIRNDLEIEHQNESKRKEKSKVSKWLDKYIFLDDDEAELKYMGFIGRWRKLNLSKRFRESIFDAFAADYVSK